MKDRYHKKANVLGHVVLLDPVGAGASGLRTKTANELVRDIKFTVIRGNISEIRTLMEGTGNTKGVDADLADAVTEENLDETIGKLKAFSEATGSVIAVTGAIDLVADSEKCYVIRNGKPEMGAITGTGCQLCYILDGNLIIDQYLNNFRTFQLLESLLRLYDRDGAGVSYSVYCYHNSFSFRK